MRRSNSIGEMFPIADADVNAFEKLFRKSAVVSAFL